MIKYEIQGGSLPVVICYPEAGETLCTERGAMSWMSPNMKMQTNTGGLGKAMGRMFSGESIFLNEYTAQGGTGMIAFSSSFSVSAFSIANNLKFVKILKNKKEKTCQSARLFFFSRCPLETEQS